MEVVFNIELFMISDPIVKPTEVGTLGVITWHQFYRSKSNLVTIVNLYLSYLIDSMNFLRFKIINKDSK